MSKINSALIDSIRTNKTEIAEVIGKTPDWGLAGKKFNLFYSKMTNLKDGLWSEQMIQELGKIYYEARENDTGQKKGIFYIWGRDAGSL